MTMLKSRIIKLISEGKTDKALDVFEEELKTTNSPLYRELALINAEFIDVNKSVRTNLISREEAQRVKNRINDSLISILDQSEDWELTQSETQEKASLPAEKKEKPIVLFSIIGGLLFVFLSILVLFLINKDDPNEGLISVDSSSILSELGETLPGNAATSAGLEDSTETISSPAALSDSNEVLNSPDEVDDTTVSKGIEEIDDGIDDNETVYKLVTEELGLTIYNDYKDVYLFQNSDSFEASEISKAKRDDVLKRTGHVVRQLVHVKDEEIELYSKIYKYIGLLVSNKILALTAKDTIHQIEYTNTAFICADSLDHFIKEISNIDDRGLQIELQQWIFDAEHEQRILVNKFICLAANHKAGGQVTAEEIKRAYKKMLKAYGNILEKEGYHIYPIIEWLFNQGIIEHKHH